MARKRDYKVVRLPEREVIRAVQNHFTYNRNVRIWRRNTGAVETENRFIRFGVPGMSDFFGIIKRITCPECGRLISTGVHLEIECKRFGGRVTPQQSEYIQTIREFNGVAIIAAPVPSANDPTGLTEMFHLLDTVDRELCIDCEEKNKMKGTKE